MFLPKPCLYFPSVRCYFSSCSFLDYQGNVRVCRNMPHPERRDTPKKVASVRVSVFSKHLKGGGIR